MGSVIEVKPDELPQGEHVAGVYRNDVFLSFHWFDDAWHLYSDVFWSLGAAVATSRMLLSSSAPLRKVVRVNLELLLGSHRGPTFTYSGIWSDEAREECVRAWAKPGAKLAVGLAQDTLWPLPKEAVEVVWAGAWKEDDT